MGICGQESKTKPVQLSQTEKAILECKKCRDKIKSYIRRLSEREKKSRAKVKELLANKQRDRAKFYLRQAKLHEAQMKTYYGQLEMIENQVNQIESAENLQNVYTVLNNGNAVLKKMQDKVKIEEWEKVKDDLEELKEKDKEVSDFLKEYGINEAEYDNEVNNDLDKLINEINGNKAQDINLPSVPKEQITNEEKSKEKNQENKKLVLA